MSEFWHPNRQPKAQELGMRPTDFEVTIVNIQSIDIANVPEVIKESYGSADMETTIVQELADLGVKHLTAVQNATLQQYFLNKYAQPKAAKESRNSKPLQVNPQDATTVSRYATGKTLAGVMMHVDHVRGSKSFSWEVDFSS